MTLGESLFKRIRSDVTEAQWLFNSNYGRFSNIEIRYNSQVIGRMRYLQNVDMFWSAYEVSYLPEFETIIKSYGNWTECVFEIWNADINACYDNAFAAGNCREFCEGKTNTIDMRGMYFHPSSKMVRFFISMFIVFLKPSLNHFPAKSYINTTQQQI